MMSAFPSRWSQIWALMYARLGAQEPSGRRHGAHPSALEQESPQQGEICSGAEGVLRGLQKGGGHGLGIPEKPLWAEAHQGRWQRALQVESQCFTILVLDVPVPRWSSMKERVIPLCCPTERIREELRSGSLRQPSSVTSSKSLHLFQVHIALCSLVKWSWSSPPCLELVSAGSRGRNLKSWTLSGHGWENASCSILSPGSPSPPTRMIRPPKCLAFPFSLFSVFPLPGFLYIEFIPSN